MTYKEDIFLLDKLFQLRSIRNQPTLLEKSEMEELQGKVVVVFGGTYGIGQDICEICREYKTSLYVYSRSTGVDVSNSQGEFYLKYLIRKDGLTGSLIPLVYWTNSLWRI